MENYIQDTSRNDRLRNSVIRQLKRNMSRCQKTLKSEGVNDLKVREKFIQLHTSTAQVLNQIMKDNQNRKNQLRLIDLRRMVEQVEQRQKDREQQM